MSPQTLEATYWPLRLPHGSWWLTDADAPPPRITYARFRTERERMAWLAANGYKLAAWTRAEFGEVLTYRKGGVA